MEAINNLKKWSGKRDSNSRPSPWQGDALPAELFPQFLIQLNFTSLTCIVNSKKLILVFLIKIYWVTTSVEAEEEDQLSLRTFLMTFKILIKKD